MADDVVSGILDTNYYWHEVDTMIQIHDAKVETLDATQARPVGSTVLAVTIGDHVFQMLVDEDELIRALASRYSPPCKPAMIPPP